jgi:hypothetical protein
MDEFTPLSAGKRRRVDEWLAERAIEIGTDRIAVGKRA